MDDRSAELDEWLKLADDLVGAADAVAAGASANRSSGPQLAVMALLACSVGHLRAVALLIRHGLVVEARTLTRSLFENQFLIAALEADGDSTFEALMKDHLASREKRGKLILKNTEVYSREQREQVDAFMQQQPKGKILNPMDTAKRSGAFRAYQFYAQLSADSVHPSFDSLERHLTVDEQDVLKEISWEARADPNEPRDTTGWACMAFLGILAISQKVIGAGAASAAVQSVRDEYSRLTGRLSDDVRAPSAVGPASRQ